MMIKTQIIPHQKFLIFLMILSFTRISASNNKLFWDGRDWLRVEKLASYDVKTEFIIKKSYLEGALDGR
ncbi:MAG: hypothetical protein CMF94_03685, partial [Candidatus Marinimicrobia bacterium]|nr:hypothetical protein [Candidatus Neomarinimicrobiota bacterium]